MDTTHRPTTGSTPPSGSTPPPRSSPPSGSTPGSTPPPPGPPAPPWTRATPAPPSRPWRDRLPELVATIGTSLVVVAIVGFVTSSWEQLSTVHRAMALAAVAVGLTVAGIHVEGARRRSMSRVVALVHLSASVSVGASATLFAYAAQPGWGRLGIAVGGLAAAAHAGWVLARDLTSPTRVVAVGVALLYAAGPAGSAIGDRFSTMDPTLLAAPVLGLFDPAVRTDQLLLAGIGWALTGAVLLALGTRLRRRCRHAATVMATGVLFAAAAMLNVATDPLGAFAALCIVVGYLLHGLVAERPGVTVVGAVGVLVAGIRVVWGLFSGQVAVTVAALVVGVAMLAWAVRAARTRPEPTDHEPADREATDREPADRGTA